MNKRVPIDTVLERPSCEFKGCLPHSAIPAYLLIWSLLGGPVVKWSCEEHRFSFGGNRSYAVAKFECFRDTQPPRSHEIAAVLDILEEAKLREMTDEEERAVCESDEETTTCVDPECGNPARKGEWCDQCQSRWEEEQQATARRERRSINEQKGF
jgi:hypothetical protein